MKAVLPVVIGGIYDRHRAHLFDGRLRPGYVVNNKTLVRVGHATMSRTEYHLSGGAICPHVIRMKPVQVAQI